MLSYPSSLSFCPIVHLGGGDKSVTKTLSSNAIDAGKQTQELIFDSTKFKLKYVLGSGSFGVVTFAEYTDPVTKTTTGYALKSLSKATVIETGQLRHVMDERRLLSLMNSRFVLKLHGTYQTPHQLVMVTEPLDCGDLWSVIYETYPYNENDGLTVTLMCFYAASLVLALSHVHKQGRVMNFHMVLLIFTATAATSASALITLCLHLSLANVLCLRLVDLRPLHVYP